MNRHACLLALGLLGGPGSALALDLGTPGDTFRSTLTEAQVELVVDPVAARTLVKQADAVYRRQLAPNLSRAAPAAARTVQVQLERALAATQRTDEAGLAVARSLAWTALLGGAEQALEASIKANHPDEAQQWLALREFRPVNRYTRLNVDATETLMGLSEGKLTPDEALSGVRSDLLDGYQARLQTSLDALALDLSNHYPTRAAEHTALAQGYFTLLKPAFTQQRGAQAATDAAAIFARLPASLTEANALLAGFRAAPLSPREQLRRAGQALRYLKLVPVEYGRGVAGEGQNVVVKRDLEVTEARTFLDSSVGAYADVAPLLKDQVQAEQVRQGLRTLQADLARSATRTNPVGPGEVQARVDTLSGQLDTLFPAAWKRHDTSGDLDVIRSQLTALQNAVAAGDYALAETARIDAYATLESGPEARISVFAPELKLRLEGLFWNGTAPRGLARLIQERANVQAFQATRAQLDLALIDTSKLLGTDVAPAAVATNAGVIVFREGLEAVLILAALMGSLRRPEVLHLRRPMWVGAAGAFLASVLTWFVMQGTLTLFAQYGEKLSAVVSLIAIGVLLIIMNWFAHNVYWTDRMAVFQKQKHNLVGRNVGQWIGLAVLGFTSIFREGFESVLFLQSLVLSSGAAVVLVGTGLGLLAVVGVGVLIFLFQAKLPMKKLLIWTGAMICVVLFIMVGNTLHVMQLVGWVPVHPLPLQLPAWLGLWLGLYATWEGVLLQVSSVTAVIGSFFLAEALKARSLQQKLSRLPSRE